MFEPKHIICGRMLVECIVERSAKLVWAEPTQQALRATLPCGCFLVLSLAEFVTEIEELWCNYCLSGTISIQMLEKVRLLRVLTFYPLDTLKHS